MPEKIHFIPMAERAAVLADHLSGKKKREIARERHHSQESVARIIRDADLPSYFEKVRGRFVGLGMVCVDVLEARVRGDKTRGDHELAYRVLKGTGILADVEARNLAARVANGGGPQTQVALTPEARDLILNALSSTDRQLFRVLKMFQEKSQAYGMEEGIELPALKSRPTSDCDSMAGGEPGAQTVAQTETSR